MSGVKLEFDTCLSINEREVVNTLKIIEDNYVIFTCGAAIIIRDLSHLNRQTIVAKKGLLRNVTALDAYTTDKNKQLALIIGESSSTDKTSILIHHVVLGEENVWTTLTTNNIYGEVKRIHINPKQEKRSERKQILALVQSQDEPKKQKIYLWNFQLDKKVGEHILDALLLDDISFHPIQQKKVKEVLGSLYASAILT
jgi:hypothetical protein